MKYSAIAASILALSLPAKAAMPLTGKHTCRFFGQWTCNAEGICIGGIRPALGSFRLTLDFNRSRARMADFDGTIVRLRDGLLVIDWKLSLLGRQRLAFRETTLNRGGAVVIASLSDNLRDARGFGTADFNCGARRQ